ncbi:MAG: M23 family metallopeptidase [Actinomycetota bacterium]
MAPTWCLVLSLAIGLLPVPASMRSSGPTPGPRTAATGASPLLVQGWEWPVVGPVIRGFDPPDDPYGAGHRGIDIAASVGTTILAPEPGVVSFAGTVGGHLFVTLDHGGGLQSTYSWLSVALVRKGDVVARGGGIGLTGQGHPGAVVPHLHFGVRLDGAYLDPLGFLGAAPVADLIHLAPDLETAEALPRVA